MKKLALFLGATAFLLLVHQLVLNSGKKKLDYKIVPTVIPTCK